LDVGVAGLTRPIRPARSKRLNQDAGNKNWNAFQITANFITPGEKM
jgi:hypothetical protein